MKFLIFVAALSFALVGSASAFAAEKRCGWIDNPTPANWDLTDSAGVWTIGVQGGYQAKGDVPNFPDSDDFWVTTNSGSKGYGCACLMVNVNKKTKRILEIKSGEALSLKKCSADKKLKHRDVEGDRAKFLKLMENPDAEASGAE